MNKTESPENDPKPTADLANQALDTILEMKESSEDRPTTQPPLNEKEHRQNWIAKWLPMEPTHQQVIDAQNAVYDFCMAYGKRPARGAHLLIIGENGAGKSRLAKKAARWADDCRSRLPHVACDPWMCDGTVSARRPSVEFHNFPFLLREMTSDFNREWLRELCTPPSAPNLLVLDDIGAEHDPSKYGAAQLYLILESRAQMWTLLTTNCLPAQWEQKWDRRVASRLLRNTQHVFMDQVPDFSTRK